MKQFPSLVVAMLLASTTHGQPAWGQTVYRCGNLYAQSPCPDALTVDASDTRTPAQKAQTDAAARQAARSADKLEKDRLAVERRALAGPSTKTLKPAHAGTGTAPDVPATRTSAKQNKKLPEYFTAAVATDTRKENKAGSKPGDQKPLTDSAPAAKQ